MGEPGQHHRPLDDRHLLEVHQQSAVETLASLANAEHEACEHALADSLHHARMAGIHLLQAKERLGHGEWIRWLIINFRGKPRTAQAYMRVAREWDAVQAANTQSSAYLGYTAALAALAEPKTAEPESPLDALDGDDYHDWLERQEALFRAWDVVKARLDARDTPLTREEAEQFTALAGLQVVTLREGIELYAPLWEALHRQPFSRFLTGERERWSAYLTELGVAPVVAEHLAGQVYAEVGS